MLPRGLWIQLAVLLCCFGGVFCEYCHDRYTTGDEKAAKSSDITGWIIGICLCIGSALASVFGVSFQKLAHTKNEAAAVKKAYVKLPLWWVGIVCVILGAILDFLSLGFAPQTVVASLGSMTLVINTVVAPLMLKEKLSRLEIFGTFTITFGAGLAVSSSSQKKQDYNLDILKCLYKQTGFIVYAVIIGIWCISLHLLFRKAEQIERLDIPERYFPRWARLHPFSLTALSGTLGAQSLLFAKSVSIIIRGIYAPTADSDGVSALAQYETYLILFAMVFTIVSQTHTLNMALQRFDSVIVLPLFQVFWIIMGVFGAGAYFKEFDGMGTTQAVLFPLGILIIGLGIGILTSRVSSGRLHDSVAGLDFPLATTESTDDPKATTATTRSQVQHDRRTSRLVSADILDVASRRFNGRILSVSGALIAATTLIDESDETLEILRQRKRSRRLMSQRMSTAIPLTAVNALSGSRGSGEAMLSVDQGSANRRSQNRLSPNLEEMLHNVKRDTIGES